jgi:hypothetical protein
VIAGALGDGVISAADSLFDSTRALKSIRIYESDLVPRLDPPFPDGVTRVEFDVDLSRAEFLDVDAYSACPALLKSAAPL